jgi:hypothetical protein
MGLSQNLIFNPLYQIFRHCPSLWYNDLQFLLSLYYKYLNNLPSLRYKYAIFRTNGGIEFTLINLPFYLVHRIERELDKIIS